MDKIKGVILAGGLGKRLEALTRITNKPLLPVYDKPMIFYPLRTLIESGIEDILIVTGGNHAGEFLRLLGNGDEFGLKEIKYAYQKGEAGIADALRLAEHFAEGGRIVVMLGDNIIEHSIKPYVDNFRTQEKGARVLIKEVPDPGRFGVVELKDNRIISIDEKPDEPKSKYVTTGIYMYDADVFRIIDGLKPSARGELEITDVNNVYLEDGKLQFDILEGWWTDAGTFDSLLRANNLIAEKASVSAGKRTKAD